MSDWSLEKTELFERRLKHSIKRYPDETLAMLNNLDTYLESLNRGINVAQITASFIHHEQKGVIAIDQKGAKGYPTQTRLYIYPDEETRSVHVITIEEKGKKKFQQQQVNLCCKYVESLKKEKKDGQEI